ncbi:hypothetical protein ACN38_g8756 [Penicillium nordicum]|uniref:Uncharacterized protein n=1 Tax=Penicillium nordicum TaxID=229535 RepID=A0A0M9WD72_9EURO|nr:hypothetical protein ACN38_g8756 [Penicillium nordicum]
MVPFKSCICQCVWTISEFLISVNGRHGAIQSLKNEKKKREKKKERKKKRKKITGNGSQTPLRTHESDQACVSGHVPVDQ